MQDNIFNFLFDNSSDGIFLSDLNGNIIEVNRIAVEMMGYTRIQRSVWINPYGYTDEALRAYRKLKKFPLEENDRIHIFIIPKWSYEKVISIGPQPPKPKLGEIKIF